MTKRKNWEADREFIHRIDSPEYRAEYSKGWRYGRTGADGVRHGDTIGAPAAWYDGYFDQVADRRKWHLLTCTGCDRHPMANQNVDRP
jgi:hypothetical protein